MAAVPPIRITVSAYHQRIAGFTLVELMITIAVLAVILAIATPSFTTVINNNRLTAQTNDLVAALQMARSEALKRNSSVAVCRSVTGTSCAGAVGVWEQWIIADSDGEMMRHGQARSPVQLSADEPTVSFRGNGMAQDAAEIVVCLPTNRPAENVRRIAVSAAGRVAVVSENGEGECA